MNTDVFTNSEKPANPKSTLASMGYTYYVGDAEGILIRDEQTEDSDHDFGKDIIPAMLADGRRMFAYRFNGYWKDVGTIQAYWESSMDLVKRVPEFNLYDPEWRIYTPNPVKPPHYIASTGSVKTSVVAEGCMIYGTVRNSVLFPGVTVEKDALIEHSIVMSNSHIGEGSVLDHCIIGENVTVGRNVRVGVGENIPNEDKPGIYNSGITVVGERAGIPDDTVIGKNVMIDMHAGGEDFCSNVIPSGASIYKGGECE